MFRSSLAACLGLAVCASAQASVTYSDTVGDLFDNGMANLDIASVEVYHDEANIYMNINLAGDLGPGSNWGKYLVAIDAFDGGTGSNPWGRNINFNGTEVDRFLGSWVDGGGGHNAFSHFGGWNEEFGHSSMYYSESGFVDLTISRDWLGLADGGSFSFDVMSTAGGAFDPGVDHLSRSDMATPWWDTTSVSGDFLVYEVPAPGALVLLGLAGIMHSRRRH